MSIRLMTGVWDLDLEFNKAWVLMALADSAHDDGTRCFPGVERIAYKTGYSKRQVRRVLQGLRDDGLIEPVAFLGGGRGRATEYELHLEKGDKKAPFVKEDISERVTPRDVNPDATGQKDAIAVAPQPSVTIIEPSEEPSVYTREEPPGESVDYAWVVTLREIDEWAAKGEPHMEPLFAWTIEKGYTRGHLEAAAIGLAATSGKTLKGYRNLAAAFQRRLNEGYDRVPLDGRQSGGDQGRATSGRAAGWDNNPDRA
jgi:hypothetical protein